MAQTKQDEGLNEGSGSGEGKEWKFCLLRAAPVHKGRNGAQTPEGWILDTMNLEPRSYFSTVSD